MSSRLILNNNDYAVDFRTKINTNFETLFSNNVPTNHAVSSGTYGLGTTGLYGHLRVTNSNGLAVNNGTVSMSQATTSAFGAVRLANSATSTSSTDVVTGALMKTALDTVLTTVNNGRAPINHASSSTSYGVATNVNYGHIRVVNGNGLTLNSGTLAMSAGSTSAFGAVRLASAISNNNTNVVTSAQMQAFSRGFATINRVYYGTGNPSNSTGIDGDIYIKYS